MKRLIYEGKFTAGYYNDMEAGHPVFIDDLSLSDLVKSGLIEKGINPDFCYGTEECETKSDVKNPLIGKKVKLIIEIED